MMQGAYLGPEFTQADTEQRLNDVGAKFDVLPERSLDRLHGARLG